MGGCCSTKFVRETVDDAMKEDRTWEAWLEEGEAFLTDDSAWIFYKDYGETTVGVA